MIIITEMKKILFAIAIVLTIGLTASAQSDGFFKWNDVDNNDIYRSSVYEDPTLALPSAHGLNENQDLPLGSGLLVLTALGAGYALARKKDNN